MSNYLTVIMTTITIIKIKDAKNDEIGYIKDTKKEVPYIWGEQALQV